MSVLIDGKDVNKTECIVSVFLKRLSRLSGIPIGDFVLLVIIRLPYVHKPKYVSLKAV